MAEPVSGVGAGTEVDVWGVTATETGAAVEIAAIAVASVAVPTEETVEMVPGVTEGPVMDEAVVEIDAVEATICSEEAGKGCNGSL